MNPDIDSVLEEGEKIVWKGAINRKVLFFGLVIFIAIVGLIGSFLITRGTINYTSNGQPAQVSGMLVGSIVLIIGLSIALYSYFSDLVKEYAITKKRVLIKSGLIGTDFKSIYFDQIKNVIVDVGLLGKIFSVGSVKIDIGEMETYSTGGGYNPQRGTYRPTQIRSRVAYDVLKNIEQPYEVYKHMQSSLSERKESLYSGRADRESHPEAYK